MRTPKSKALYVSAAVLGLIGVSGVTANAAYKTVTVRDNGKQKVLHGLTFGNVGDFLKQNGISYARDAKISPQPVLNVTDGMDITIQEPKRVTLVDGNHSEVYHTFANTVGQFLRNQQVVLSPTDNLNVSKDANLTDGEKIQIQRVNRQVTVDHKVIPFHTVHRKASNLYVGQSRVVTRGVNGSEKITKTKLIVNGQNVARSVNTTVEKKPVNQVIETGTRLRPVHLASRSFNPLSGNTEKLRVEVTAYVEGGHTATGTRAVPGVAAVDPSVIPLGSRIMVPGFGTVVAQDTGGAIRGNHIDICVATEQEALRWGIRYITVEVQK